DTITSAAHDATDVEAFTKLAVLDAIARMRYLPHAGIEEAAARIMADVDEEVRGL
ncbi:MAG: hypothetical protein GWN79_11725, partial [Actinobacteria bacterium]|nr:hypothetical protein [Actinomycetota bacterium]NIU19716.1 hypothetical protein [Actinomycetota bacterium]NIV56199.1 hypothetical protein [Actinomycetota bacterium]NIX51015.1 hypothetical protein [Actinomycetota bacterium]